VRLYGCGNDLTPRFPLIVDALARKRRKIGAAEVLGLSQACQELDSGGDGGRLRIVLSWSNVIAAH
jgi:hypothetical protein